MQFQTCPSAFDTVARSQLSNTKVLVLYTRACTSTAVLTTAWHLPVLRPILWPLPLQDFFPSPPYSAFSAPPSREPSADSSLHRSAWASSCSAAFSLLFAPHPSELRLLVHDQIRSSHFARHLRAKSLPAAADLTWPGPASSSFLPRPLYLLCLTI
ncbi:hypothetical protein HDV57DRAFT_259597 [Trichoderma longibrachiatum]|uniref:Uncharacterized protein n=1 Tax=Trichoderma longibrachiatum ATCC 18648 TaxID=983965 RepID=A0A2T4BTQ2_TRILO|nr:hypothetical protein M440DRAFT_148366 [Trichoderma longibrachiatum ATCC 18648]